MEFLRRKRHMLLLLYCYWSWMLILPTIQNTQEREVLNLVGYYYKDFRQAPPFIYYCRLFSIREYLLHKLRY